MRWMTEALVATVLISSTTLVAQEPGDPAAHARGTEKIGQWSAPLTSCEDYLQADLKSQRWYIAGMNQAYYFAQIMISIEHMFELEVDATGGGEIGSIARLKLEALRSVQESLNRMLPPAGTIGDLTIAVGSACRRSGDFSLPLTRFYREAVEGG